MLIFNTHVFYFDSFYKEAGLLWLYQDGKTVASIDIDRHEGLKGKEIK